MFDSHQKRSSILRADYQRRLGGAEYIYLDASTANLLACTLLLEDVCNARTSYRLIMTLSALQELLQMEARREKESPFLQTLLQVPTHLARPTENRVGHLHFMSHEDETWQHFGEKLLALGSKSADAPFVGEEMLLASIMQKAPHASQVIISQDRWMLEALHEMASRLGWGSGALSILSMNERGELYEPLAPRTQEDEEGLAEVAAMNLEAIVRNNRLYIDASALGADSAKLLLRRLKPLLQTAGKCLHVLAFRHEFLPQAELLIARAQEEPPTVRFVWLDSEHVPGAEPGRTALLALERDGQEARRLGQSLALISNAAMATSLPAQTVVYSVNRHGFLTRRGQMGGQEPDATQLDHRASLQEQMQEAVKQGDTEKARKLAVHHNTLETGLYTALRERNADMLDLLVEAADRFPSKTLRWWLLDSQMFREPDYLAAHPRFYHILVRALCKAEFGPVLAGKISHRLWELRSQEGASEAELDFLISLFREAIDSSEPNAELLRVNCEACMGELPHSFSPELVRVKEELLESEFAFTQLTERLQQLEQELADKQKEQRALSQRKAELFMELCVLTGPILMDSSALLCGQLRLFRSNITPILARHGARLSASCRSVEEVADSSEALAFLSDKSIMTQRRDEEDSFNSADVLLRVLSRCGRKVNPVLITQRHSFAEKAREVAPGTLVCCIDSEGKLLAYNN